MDWWNYRPAPEPQEEEQEEDVAPTQAPPPPPHHARGETMWTTLGHLKHLNHWAFPYFEHVYLSFIKQCLTEGWPRIQGGSEPTDLNLWKRICIVLELDRKAMADLMLLAHSGEAGRTEANEVLWTLLSDHALRDDYEDLSKMTSSLVLTARKNMDRPPGTHKDLKTWHWAKYWVPRNPKFAPSAVPQGAVVQNLDDKEPIPPPECWTTLLDCQ